MVPQGIEIACHLGRRRRRRDDRHDAPDVPTEPAGPEGPPLGLTMARRYEFEASARSTAPAEAIWPLIGDASRWKEWSWMTTHVVCCARVTLAPDGVGALRRFAFGPGRQPGGGRGLGAPSAPGLRRACAGSRCATTGPTSTSRTTATGTVVTWRCSVEPLDPRHRLPRVRRLAICCTRRHACGGASRGAGSAGCRPNADRVHCSSDRNNT